MRYMASTTCGKKTLTGIVSDELDIDIRAISLELGLNVAFTVDVLDDNGLLVYSKFVSEDESNKFHLDSWIAEQMRCSVQV